MRNKIIFFLLILLILLFPCFSKADLQFLNLPFLNKNPQVLQGWYYNDGSIHKGIDYPCTKGENIYAAADGLAMSSFQPGDYAYGNFVLINHQNGYFTLYGHLDSIENKIKNYSSNQRNNKNYEEWTSIKRGEVVGKCGNSGTQAVHLHFEFSTGYAIGKIDPYDIYKIAAYYPPVGLKFGELGKNHFWSTETLAIILPSQPSLSQSSSLPSQSQGPSFFPPPPGLAGGSDTLSFWDKVAFYWNGFVANLKQLFGGTTGEVQVAKPLTNTEIQQQVNQEIASPPARNDNGEATTNDNGGTTTNNPQQSTENSSPSAQSEVWNQRFISYELTEKDKEQGIYQLVLKFQNTGNTTWTPNNVSLNIVGGYQSTAAKFYHPSWTTKLRPTKLITTIEPGGNAFFTFLLQFPKEPGAYYPQFQPVYYDGTNFHWIGSDKAIFLAEIKESSPNNFAFAGASLEETTKAATQGNNQETTPTQNNSSSSQNSSSSNSSSPSSPLPSSPSSQNSSSPVDTSSSQEENTSLLAPNNLTFNNNSFTFNWKNVDDVTYILEVNNEENFNKEPKLQKELTQSQYTLTLDEIIIDLGPGKFFWRVKAKSGDKESDWSETSSFVIPHITVVSKGDSIQSAVDAANPGDIIIVDDGIYKENININKNNLILKSKNGSEKTIVEAADSHDHIFEITANNIEISGFTIRNAIGIWNAGIYTSNGNIKINNNIFQNNYISIWSVGTGMQQEKLFIEDNKFSETPSSSSYGGIYLQRGGANNATITINTIKNNTFNSVYNIVVGRSTSIITNNIFTSSSLELGGTSIQLENCNFENGGVLINQGAYNNIDLAVKNTYINDNPLLYLKGASNYNIENNYGQIILVGCSNVTVQNFNISNTIAAVQLINSTNNTILNNTFNKNNYGIYAIQSSYNNITNNNISDSTESGIYLQNGSFNKVLGNNISNNNGYGYADGIYLNGSNNIISNNTIKDNNYGIKLWTASNNTVKENQILNNGIGIDLYYAKNNVIYNNIFSNNTKNINMWGENSGNIWQAPE